MGGCLSQTPTLQPGTRAILFVRDAQLGTEHIQVQLVRETGAAGRRPLLLYATGDGGWRSADRGLFQHLAGWGYPLAGFSAQHHPGYLPAARARQLFGPDGERRRFYAIEAESHTFAGAREALYDQARIALDWIVACGPEDELRQSRPAQ